jgi:ribosomal protein S26
LPEKVYFSKKRIASRYCDHKMGDALLLLLLLHALCTCTTNRGGPLRWGTCKTCKPEGSSVSRVYNTIVDKRIAGTTENLYSALPEVSCCVDCNRYKVSKIVDETSWQEMQIKSQVCVSWALSLHVTRARSRERIHTHILHGPIVLECQRAREKTLSLSLSRSFTLSFFLSLVRAHSFFLSFSGSVSEVGLFNFKNSASTSSTRKRTCSLCACSLATNCEHSFFRRYCQAL